MAATSGVSSSDSSIATSEETLLAEQQAAYAQEQKFETESAIMQSKHDTMMAIIRSIAQ
jgi:hypothetical protein